MHDRFVHRMERAFASGWERRASAASYQPITLPGRPVVAVPAEARPPAPPLPPEARGWGPNLDCDSRENQNSVPEPGDLIGPYSRSSSRIKRATSHRKTALDRPGFPRIVDIGAPQN